MSMQNNKKIDEKILDHQARFINTICGGLVAINLLTLQAFLSLTTLDIPEYISIASLAIAIPLLAGCLFINNYTSNKYSWKIWGTLAEGKRDPDKSIVVFVSGIIVSLIGVGAAFWHISWVIGIIFYVSVLLTFLGFAQKR